jgi:hypothetical protein
MLEAQSQVTGFEWLLVLLRLYTDKDLQILFHTADSNSYARTTVVEGSNLPDEIL